MIQRKQTVYLFAIILLMAMMLFMPLAKEVSPEASKDKPVTIENTDPDGTIHRTTLFAKNDVTYNVWGKTTTDGAKECKLTFLSIFVILAMVLAAVTMFLYKKRKTQLKLTFFIIIILLAISAYTGMYLWELNEKIKTENISEFSFAVAAIAPVIALICGGFAYFGIKSDIKLINSLDRIR